MTRRKMVSAFEVIQTEISCCQQRLHKQFARIPYSLSVPFVFFFLSYEYAISSLNPWLYPAFPFLYMNYGQAAQCLWVKTGNLFSWASTSSRVVYIRNCRLARFRHARPSQCRISWRDGRATCRTNRKLFVEIVNSSKNGVVLFRLALW